VLTLAGGQTSALPYFGLPQTLSADPAAGRRSVRGG